jgi:hypothetical protein
LFRQPSADTLKASSAQRRFLPGVAVEAKVSPSSSPRQRGIECLPTNSSRRLVMPSPRCGPTCPSARNTIYSRPPSGQREKGPARNWPSFSTGSIRARSRATSVARCPSRTAWAARHFYLPSMMDRWATGHAQPQPRLSLHPSVRHARDRGCRPVFVECHTPSSVALPFNWRNPRLVARTGAKADRRQRRLTAPAADQTCLTPYSP